MAKFFVPANGPDDWQGLLSNPSKQWRTGYSAKTLAYCWEAAIGFPESVSQVFSESGYPVLRDMKFALGLPEYRTPLPGRGWPSQSDIFVVARTKKELICLTVEGKVDEEFGQLTSEWLGERLPNKRERLAGLCKLLRVSQKQVANIRYQLLHRTAAALIEAERFYANTAIMLVHSFSQEHKWFEDYQAFIGLFGKSSEPNSVTYIGRKNGIALYTAWVVGEPQFLTA